MLLSVRLYPLPVKKSSRKIYEEQQCGGGGSVDPCYYFIDTYNMLVLFIHTVAEKMGGWGDGSVGKVLAVPL